VGIDVRKQETHKAGRNDHRHSKTANGLADLLHMAGSKGSQSFKAWLIEYQSLLAKVGKHKVSGPSAR
jgi:hypothetical protein